MIMMILMSSQRIVNEIPMNRHGMQQERRNGRQADLPITRRRNDLTNCFRGYLLAAEMLLGQHVWEWNRGRHCSQRDKDYWVCLRIAQSEMCACVNLLSEAIAMMRVCLLRHAPNHPWRSTYGTKQTELSSRFEFD